MTWPNFNLLKYEADQFRESLDRRVCKAYLTAFAVLEKAHREAIGKLYEQLSKETDEESNQLTVQVIDYEEILWTDQREALAAMALTLLAGQTKSFLDEQKGRCAKSYPPDPPSPKGYPGGSELLKLVSEYDARFKIKLDLIDGFDTVREITLARNCCVHGGSIPSGDYKQQTKQRLLNDNGHISLTPEQLESIVTDLSQFAKSMSAQLSELPKLRAKPIDPL